jgi:transcriptional regulator with XRE-family HTH domain
MHRYIWETPEEINLTVAKNVKTLRKRKGISQQKLSQISGVSYGTIKRFESTGNISFLSLTKLAVALDAAGDVKSMFTDVPYQSIEEVINEQK